MDVSETTTASSSNATPGSTAINESLTPFFQLASTGNPLGWPQDISSAGINTMHASGPLPVAVSGWRAAPWAHLSSSEIDLVSRSAPPSAAVSELAEFGPNGSEQAENIELVARDILADATQHSIRSTSNLMSNATPNTSQLYRDTSPYPSQSSSSRAISPSTFSYSVISHPTGTRSTSPSSNTLSNHDSQPLQFARPPTHSQRSEAHDSITIRKGYLASLDVEVELAQQAVRNAQKRYQELLAQRAAFCAQIARDKNRLQPALYLPLETLAEIFCYCVENDPYAAWKVSSVCFDWRVAALSHPRIWCRIVIPDMPQDDQLMTICRWLERSRAASGLDIYFRVIVDTVRYSTGHFEDMMSMLALQMHRWRSFELETNLDDYIHLCMRKCVGSAPLLERFMIRGSDIPATRNRRILPCKNIKIEPGDRLQHVALYTNAWYTAPFLHDLRSLTIVSGRARRMSDIWVVLRACPELETLTMRLPVDADANTNANASTGLVPLRLDKLHHLAGNGMILAILPHLIIPSLCMLEANDVDGFVLMRTLNVLDLRSNPPLHTLRLRNCRLFSGTTGLSLKSIKRLEFYDSEVDDNFFLSLSMPTAGTSSWIRPYRTWALPSLESILLRKCHYIREDALRRFVEARNPSAPGAVCVGGAPAVGLPARIRSVEVKECRRVREGFVKWIGERLGRVCERFAVPISGPIANRGPEGTSSTSQAASQQAQQALVDNDNVELDLDGNFEEFDEDDDAEMDDGDDGDFEEEDDEEDET